MIPQPNGLLYLLQNVPIENYQNQLDFRNEEEQANYFLTKRATKSYPTTGYTFLREHQAIQIEIKYDSSIDCNYLMYQNNVDDEDVPAPTGKWYYCFITRSEYINEYTTRFYIQEDAWQTWQFQIKFQQSFIERMHVSSDQIGEHVVDEGLGIGEYITRNTLFKTFSSWWIVIQSTVDLSQSDLPPTSSTRVNGIYSGVATFVYDNLNTIDSVLKRVADAGKSQAITGIYMVPKSAFPSAVNGTRVISAVYDKEALNWELKDTAPFVYQYSWGTESYRPTNNKLYCYPYMVYVLGATTGGAVDLQPQYLSNPNQISCTIIYSVFSNGCAMCYPNKYLDRDGINYNVQLSQWPQCQWIQDNFLNWSAVANIKQKWADTNNNARMWKNMGDTGINALGQLARLNPVGALIGGVQGVAQNLYDYTYNQEQIDRAMSEQTELAQIVPPSANGTANATPLIGDMSFGFYLTIRTITPDRAKQIDKYFTMYGYKVNAMDFINLRSRPYFNYFKTNGINLTGNINNDSLNKIRKMFDSGTRIWHDPTKVGDFTVDNKPGGVKPTPPSPDEPIPTPSGNIKVTINGGKGGGSYQPGDVITISANNPEDFKEWSLNPDNNKSGYFDYINVTPTKFTVGTIPVTITAEEKSKPPEPTPVEGETIADLMTRDIGAVEWDETVRKIQTWYWGSYKKLHWCASAISYYAYMGGWQKHVGKSADVDALWQQLKKKYLNRPRDGWWVTKYYGGSNTMPKRGDLIFFSGGHTLADLTHVGVVVSVSGTSITYCSGNTTNPTKGEPDGIFNKTLDITNKYIVGFCYIDYGGE